MTEQDNAIIAKTFGSAAEIGEADWQACAGDQNPFVQYAFFDALERSGSASSLTGWHPQHIGLIDEAQNISAIMPAYIKSHSQGEYVFDHAWADAYARAGGNYYPKLQISIPFTPASAPKLLIRDGVDENIVTALPDAAASATIQLGCSSAHATFLSLEELNIFKAKGWLERNDQQFHWTNRDYSTFDDFLADLTSRKRKAIRKERSAALQNNGLKIVWKTGAEITEHDWDHFFEFYQDTGARKWGTPYLNRTFFSMIGETMADQILLMFAMDGETPIAGALNFIGKDTLFGRYWGCNQNVPFLHFELCYYQAIDFAIERKLLRVEAGAQGGHKLARGYEPVTTYSAHYIAHPTFREAIEDYLVNEREHVALDQAELSDYTPFKQRSD
ncbi:GNAT family N-acetyltransferase [Maritalea sp.]|uniref:GNAT family N-acetyltransferase n=1 Tax=Maritalea sp. TaxID=2003361 RepID=UPI003EF6CC79